MITNPFLTARQPAPEIRDVPRDPLILFHSHAKGQPDDFVYVKKFTNLDTVNHNSHENSFHLENSKEDDLSESILMSEPLDQILEETPNGIFHQHQHQKSSFRNNDLATNLFLNSANQLKQQLEFYNNQLKMPVTRPSTTYISPNLRPL